ncbi:TetR/AcrR family transcriptional regulator [Pseudoxanthomonas dokdonensis]|uniref:Transcriptional regulator n=1 Tax=Pseudoxanthomonas dokdonensis TaxID=344882 RepID=A0A0R0CNE1_9GAMM|nr:TetR/AcrR family transcriptional regulator [Pseudoxanthomonas dokdonensis]KRG71083.1 transcriptional regulator [Pseudoxanthomonas dokdonensis]
MPRDTRQRILDGSLALFNSRGEPHVSTNHIADELEISPGNLYYHFRSKDDIIEHLYADYEARMDAALALPDEQPAGLEDLWLQLHLVFECICEYRFLHRDLVEILSRNRRLRLRFARLLKRSDASARQLLDGLQQTGAMQASAAERAATASNLVMISTFWLNHAAARGENDESAAIRDGIVQAMTLVAPFLRDQERRHLNALVQAYLD